MINNINNKPCMIMRIRLEDCEIGHKLTNSSIKINALKTVTSNRSFSSQIEWEVPSARPRVNRPNSNLLTLNLSRPKIDLVPRIPAENMKVSHKLKKIKSVH